MAYHLHSMRSRNTATIIETTSLVWHRLPRETLSHQVGNWFTLRAGRASLINSELVSAAREPYIEIGLFKSADKETMPRIIRALGHVAATHPCSELRGDIGSLDELGRFVRVFGQERTRITVSTVRGRQTTTVPLDEGIALLRDHGKIEAVNQDIAELGAKLIITTDGLRMADFPVPICRTEPDYP